MTEPSANPDDRPTRDLGAGPGHWLRDEREARGLSLARVAAELHLAPSLLEALEQDRHKELPAPVFVTGYLRNYARLLGLDPEPLIRAYRAANPAAESAAPRIASSSVRADGRGNPLFGFMTLAIVVGLLVLLWLGWEGRQAPLDITQVEETELPAPAPASAPALVDTPEDLPEPAADSVAVVVPSAEGEVPPDAAETQAPEPEARSADETETTATPLVAANEEPAAPALSEVVLVFDGPCWVDIRDATRQFNLFGEMGKGDRRVLGGTPPYSIIIGNAAAVTMTVDGEPFDLASRARGNVARFTLDPAAAR